ncbi:MAG TPA: SDR family oxidoreductase [Acidobacteriota bacterium]|jgi:NAD(P)-dependent dehydrogenase (short-subunit alcohol dehydrogenase family)|nr:SDR family oxidoreductase [Acidobacteriota bacterium]
MGWISDAYSNGQARKAAMKGKVVVITGGTSGIGKVAAERLAGMGARIVLVARDKARGQATIERLRHRAPGIGHSVHYADLSRLAHMKKVAAEIAAAEPRVDVLINNAGAMFNTRHVTEDGLELTFATNHVAYFVVTHGLRERLLASAPARVVNTSSDAHRIATLDFDDLQSEKGYHLSLKEWLSVGGASGFKVYARSKLANILFTRELARRFAGTGVTANCFHPGFVATRFGDESGGWAAHMIRFWKNIIAISPEKGAETMVYLASSPEVANASGLYFYKCRPATPTKEAQDDAAARRLWLETARLAGISGLTFLCADIG